MQVLLAFALGVAITAIADRTVLAPKPSPTPGAPGGSSDFTHPPSPQGE